MVAVANVTQFIAEIDSERINKIMSKPSFSERWRKKGSAFVWSGSFHSYPQISCCETVAPTATLRHSTENALLSSRSMSSHGTMWGENVTLVGVSALSWLSRRSGDCRQCWKHSCSMSLRRLRLSGNTKDILFFSTTHCKFFSKWLFKFERKSLTEDACKAISKAESQFSPASFDSVNWKGDEWLSVLYKDKGLKPVYELRRQIR